MIDTVVEAAEEAGVGEAGAEALFEHKLDRLKPDELARMAVKLEKDMKDAARKLAFEEAARLRDLLVLIRGKLT